MITVDYGCITAFFSKQSQTESEASITEHAKTMHINAKTLQISKLKNSKLFKIYIKSPLCILKVLSRCIIDLLFGLNYNFRSYGLDLGKKGTISTV